MKPPVFKALLGGLVGTTAMTLMIYFVAPMMGVHMDIAAMLGGMLGGWTMGMMMHFVLGVAIFPLAYSFLFSRVPGCPAMRGVILGALLWLALQLMVMPLMGAGVFSSHAGGVAAAGASLGAHLVYGGLLGLIATAGETSCANKPDKVASAA